jgi:hypothetical protein
MVGQALKVVGISTEAAAAVGTAEAIAAPLVKARKNRRLAADGIEPSREPERSHWLPASLPIGAIVAVAPAHPLTELHPAGAVVTLLATTRLERLGHPVGAALAIAGGPVLKNILRLAA